MISRAPHAAAAQAIRLIRAHPLAHNLASVVTIAVKAAEQEGNAGASLDLAVGVAMRRTEDKGGAPAAVE